MIDEDRLEREAISDLGVVYAAETGDGSLINLQSIYFLYQCYYKSNTLYHFPRSDSYSGRHMRNASFASSRNKSLIGSISEFGRFISADRSDSESITTPMSFSISWSVRRPR